MINPRGRFLAVLILFALAFSCENGEAELVDYKLIYNNPVTDINHTENTVHIAFESSVTLADDLIAEFILSDGAEAFIDGTIQKSGISKNSYERPFSFQIISEDEKTINIWQVVSSNNDFTEKWGMGGFLKSSRSLDRNYEWYIDQAATGPFSDVNCAPSSVVMASLWCMEDFPYSVHYARTMYHPEGGGWYTEDIDNCLTDFGINHSIIELSTSQKKTETIITEQLDEGNILILCVDVHYLRLCESDSFRVDKYYSTIKLGAGHSVIAKGYKQIDGQIFFEMYDPIGYGFKYKDGQFKGKNRYYRGKDIYTATFSRWNFAFTISDSEFKKVDVDTLKKKEIPQILIL